MNGAQHCPECGSKMSIKDTGHGGGMTYRIAECPCGIRVETVESQARRLKPQVPGMAHMPGMAGNRVEAPPPTPTPASPPSSGGGFGGSLPDGSVQIPISDSGPISVADPIRGRARSSRSANAEYPTAFERVWEETGKLGGKFPAFKAWEKAGRPAWDAIEAVWRAYLRSERPVAGFVKDLSSWLNARGHQQEWPPAAAPRRAADETFEARRKREREDAVAAESERLVFGSGWSR